MKNRYIEVVAYNPDWPLAFEAEAVKIKQALGNNCIEIHHIGSTSVPGLAAKPIIDMMPVVRDLGAVNNLAMEALGYEAKGGDGIPFRSYFTKGKDLRTHNVHIFEQGNLEIERHLNFRDWMCNNPVDKEAYAELKNHLAEKFPNDIKSYRIDKDEFIANIDAKAGWNGFRFVMAFTPKEWEAYHHIRREQIFAPINVVYDENHPSLTAENNFHFILYKGTKIVSVAHVEFLNKYESAIRSLATDEPHKRNGYGTYMMKMIEKWIKSQGHNIIKIHANPNAEDFYRKLGYDDMEFDDVSISKEIIDLGKIL
ncbi:MAG: GNAT family N-acetyltransferase [Pseudomonadota bacterium]